MCLVHIFIDLLAVQVHLDFLRVPFLVSNDQVADIGTWFSISRGPSIISSLDILVISL